MSHQNKSCSKHSVIVHSRTNTGFSWICFCDALGEVLDHETHMSFTLKLKKKHVSNRKHTLCRSHTLRHNADIRCLQLRKRFQIIYLHHSGDIHCSCKSAWKILFDHLLAASAAFPLPNIERVHVDSQTENPVPLFRTNLEQQLTSSVS